jgi:hypothetical protein
MSYRRAYKYMRHYLIASISTTLLLASILTPQIQLVDAGSKSPYDSGYDHGCDDAGISNPSDRYINEPGKGPSFHTDEFMQGYNAGYNACSVQGGGGDEPDESTGSSSRGTSSGPWTLTVRITNPPFGTDKVSTGVQGPYGYLEKYWWYWSKIQTSNPDIGRVSFDIPYNAIPTGKNFKICATNDVVIGSLLWLNCNWFNYPGGGNKEYTISLR